LSVLAPLSGGKLLRRGGDEQPRSECPSWETVWFGIAMGLPWQGEDVQ
jgi:hypothetical protein